MKSYNIQFKLFAIKFAEENSNHSASRKFGVAVKRIREWRGNKDQLEKLRQCSNGAKRFRLHGAGEKPLAREMEDVLLEWIHSRRLKGLRISRKLIMRKALHLFNPISTGGVFSTPCPVNGSELHNGTS